ncbi:MAG: Glycosyl transferase, group 1 [Parcubacteria group bacterium GW2011_GWA2_44_15]|nr:MAG: Glycosyl transferase, group 1 [Parcubacteria group bacterium GW2011_GWA2_44_15]
MEREKKLIVLYIITKSNFGGAQRYVYDLATNLPKKDFEPLVAFGGNGGLKDKLEESGIQTITIPELKRDIGILKEVRALAHIIKIIWRVRPDLVHLNSSKIGVLGALATRLYNIVTSLQFIVSSFKSKILNSPLQTKNYKLKTIFTAHGWAFKEKRSPIVKKIIGHISWLTIALCDVTIVVSKDDRKKVGKFIFVQKKIKLVHNGIGPQSFMERTAARKILAEKAGWPDPDQRLWIGSIAELHKNKGIDYALKAFGELTNHNPETGTAPEEVAYVIIGEGEERKSLESAITQEKLIGRAALMGEYPNAASLLYAFDIFLLPSLKEGLPYALLEAGAAGLPVIATNVGGVPEIIDDMKSGIVIKEKRPKEITEALAFLIAYKEKRKEFGEKLKKTVAEKFTLERMVTETIILYKELPKPNM